MIFRYLNSHKRIFVTDCKKCVEMIKIEHIALYVQDLERMRSFYETYFGLTSGTKYHNKKTLFSSYFLRSEMEGARIELMHRPDVKRLAVDRSEPFGFTHCAFALGSKYAVDTLTERLRADGWVVLSEARTTGDGYYESVIEDPEGNRIELTV